MYNYESYDNNASCNHTLDNFLSTCINIKDNLFI